MPAGKSGITKIDKSDYLTSYSIYFDGKLKTIHTYGGKAYIGIESAGHSENTQKNVVVHEFGHALGYWGHSYYKEHIMYNGNNEFFTLAPEDIAFLKQIYTFNYR